ncbi:hypothetical protein AL755_03195 (plasmid) [Arthrobacter sp. ERGS1:01]|uniref:DUF5996 family protein n=1 Tax=Arthrobacter sp. ERGS1:01 TaxID=1704044 RepID=UPI0006B57C16|nr:DUF5996 family protein [Arthrobacter sp. ERGS1:01]ALE04641.1 hypothetical protein AL755_03195 [Arthrobacter sp. ERGS1:01]
MEFVGPQTSTSPWPRLRVEDWIETRDTLHLWTQIIGKIRMAHAPLLNHWWQVPMYVSARGLTTSAIPHGGGVFDMEFNFIDHVLHIRSSTGSATGIALRAKATSEFHAEVTTALDRLGIATAIRESPVEVEPAIPFSKDDQHASYDPAAAQLFWRQLLQADRVMNQFRAYFSGKVSPVHYFWGSMDLACTRFSGRTAPRHPGGATNCADWVMVEGYSHELSSCGFWPGGGQEGAFYSYAYPEPQGFPSRPLGVDGATYHSGAKEFVLPYEHVRTAKDPDAKLLQFLQASYAAAANLGHWDRAALEVDPDRLSGYL